MHLHGTHTAIHLNILTVNKSGIRTFKSRVLQLSLEQYNVGTNFKLVARTFLEYGESRDGYWTAEKFLKQVREALYIVEYKYPREVGYILVVSYAFKGF